MILLADAYEQGQLSVEQFNEAVHARLQLGSLAKPLEEADEFTRQAARNVQDTLGESLARTLRGDFKSLEGLWIDTITTMAAEATAAQLGRALLGDFAKTGQLGGWIGEGVGWLKSALGGGSTQRAQQSGPR